MTGLSPSDFEWIPPDHNPNLTSSLWAYGDGRGPTYLGNLFGCVITFYEKLQGDCELSGSIVYSYLEDLKSKYPFTLLCKYLFNGAIGEELYENVVQYIDSKIKNLGPTCFPVVFRGRLVDHIAMIWIDEEGVKYYDPKGISSSNRKLADDKTLREILEYLNEKFTQGKGEIFENKSTDQFDAHNCGVFVCSWLAKNISIENCPNNLKDKIMEIYLDRMSETQFDEDVQDPVSINSKGDDF